MDPTLDVNGILYVGASNDPNGVGLEAFRGSTLLWQFGPPSPYKREAVVASSVIFDSTIYFGWAYDLPYLYALY